MTPIEKNVRVVDEQGNEYEATYPKRAKGLVKNGRARFVSENRICLACPPDKLLEDEKMSDTVKSNETVKISETTETSKTIGNPEYSIAYVLGQIEKIQAQTEYLNDALNKLADMSDGDSGGPGCPGNIQGEAKAKAFGDIVRCRETTNQQMLKLYEKMYDDLKPKDYTEKMLTVFEKAISGVTTCSDDSAEAISSTVDSIRQIFRENFSKK